MPERPPYSRFRRLPGLYRIGEVKPPDPHEEPQLLSLYLPGKWLDVAERLGMLAGSSTVQEYCEELLMRALDAEDAQAKAEAVDVRLDLMDDVEAMANDPGTVAAWNASAREAKDVSESHEQVTTAPALPGHLDGPRDVVLRHAGEEFGSFLATLRRGEPLSESVSGDLLGGSLARLEGGLRDASSLDRKFAFALHRLAFEGQVLLTDAHSEAAADPATVDSLRRVQEAVDRVLSGEDIRYYPTSDAGMFGGSS